MSTPTPEQIEAYLRAADAELGPECVEPWVEWCRRQLRAAGQAPMSDEPLTDAELADMERQHAHGDPWCGYNNQPRLIAEVRRLRAQVAGHAERLAAQSQLLRDVQTVLELIVTDEASIDAGLWRGPMLPRHIRRIDETLGGDYRSPFGEWSAPVTPPGV